MNSIDKILEVLQYRKQLKLAKLLTDSEFDFNESSTFGSRYYSTLTTVNIYSPIKKHDELLKLSEDEKEEIIKAFHIPFPVRDNNIEINGLEFFVHSEKPILENDKSLIQQNELEPEYWKKNYFKLFISHSSKIKFEANKLNEALSKYAISGFVAHDDIEPTKEWQSVIEDALISCDGIIALLNEDFLTSKWTNQEIGIGYAFKKIIIPVRLGVDPFGFMGKYQGLQAKDKNVEEIALAIFNLLLKNNRAYEQLSRSIINKFINSDSFNEARDNFGLIESVTYIDKEIIKELKRAGKENSQIYKSFHIPEKLGSFIKESESKLKGK